jgi:regulator of replication initiation timing
MISEFQQLSRKIEQLAELAMTLRHENAELRRNLTLVSADHTLCKEKIRQAQQRIGALLAQLPAPLHLPACDGDMSEVGPEEAV